MLPKLLKLPEKKHVHESCNGCRHDDDVAVVCHCSIMDIYKVNQNVVAQKASDEGVLIAAAVGLAREDPMCRCNRTSVAAAHDADD